MNELSHVKSLYIFALEKQEDFIAGIIDSVNYKTGFTSIEEEIDFLNRICIIEINVGNPIKFNFVPGQNNEGFDTLKIPEKFSVEHQR